MLVCFFVMQKTSYEMRSSEWSSDVCSSDLVVVECGEDLVEGSLDEGAGAPQERAPRRGEHHGALAPVVGVPAPLDRAAALERVDERDDLAGVEPEGVDRKIVG